MDNATKFAIKAALSVTLTIYLALAFGWEKPYWGAITVVVLASTETYGHALQKASHRLAGTLGGIMLGIGLMSMAQSRELFFLVFLTIGSWVAYQRVVSRFGYIYVMAFIVAAIICFSGGFNEYRSFHLAILRIQENVLGIICFTVVYSLLWPQKPETVFLDWASQIAVSLDELITTHWPKNDKGIDSAPIQALQLELKRANELLILPMKKFSSVRRYRTEWSTLLARLQQQLQELSKAPDRGSRALLKSKLEDTAQQLRIANAEGYPASLAQNHSSPPPSATDLAQSERRRAINAVISFVVATAATWAAWIFLPIPGGYILPTIATSLTINLVIYPSSVLNKVIGVVLLWAIIILAEFTFIMPMLDAGWQLALFYFINCFVMWRLFHRPQYLVVRMLGGQFLVMLTMSALYLRPVFDIVTPLLMLTLMVIVIMITRMAMQLTEQARSNI